MKQRERLLEHLKTGASIDRLSALTELGIFELSARIIDLEDRGHRISKKRRAIINRWGEKIRVVEYSINPVNIWSPGNE